MRAWLVFVPILYCCGGCRTSCPPIEPCIERRVAQVVQVAAFERPVHGETIPPVIPDQPNLADLWSVGMALMQGSDRVPWPSNSAKQNTPEMKKETGG